MQNPKFTIFKGIDSQFYFRLRATNGEIILNSEAYTTNQSCRTGIAAAKVNALIDSRYQRFDAANNYRFVLKAANGEIIGRSENYITAVARENGITAVKNDAPNAPTEDLS